MLENTESEVTLNLNSLSNQDHTGLSKTSLFLFFFDWPYLEFTTMATSVRIHITNAVLFVVDQTL